MFEVIYLSNAYNISVVSCFVPYTFVFVVLTAELSVDLECCSPDLGVNLNILRIVSL